MFVCLMDCIYSDKFILEQKTNQFAMSLPIFILLLAIVLCIVHTFWENFLSKVCVCVGWRGGGGRGGRRGVGFACYTWERNIFSELVSGNHGSMTADIAHHGRCMGIHQICFVKNAPF